MALFLLRQSPDQKALKSLHFPGALKSVPVQSSSNFSLLCNEHPVVPPKTEYSLTEWGKTLIPVVIALADWGKLLYHQAGVDLPC